MLSKMLSKIAKVAAVGASLVPYTSATDGSDLTHEICSRAIDRLLHDNVDFNEIIKENTGEWVDETFPFPEAIFWEDMRPRSPANDESAREHDAVWRRISDIFPPDSFSLWGKNEISPKDAKQGYLGDCWIHGAASAVAMQPERIKKIFLTQGLNTAGVYALQLYVMGIPVTVTVDEFLPLWFPDEDYLIYG